MRYFHKLISLYLSFFVTDADAMNFPSQMFILWNVYNNNDRSNGLRLPATTAAAAAAAAANAELTSSEIVNHSVSFGWFAAVSGTIKNRRSVVVWRRSNSDVRQTRTTTNRWCRQRYWYCRRRRHWRQQSHRRRLELETSSVSISNTDKQVQHTAQCRRQAVIV